MPLIAINAHRHPQNLCSCKKRNTCMKIVYTGIITLILFSFHARCTKAADNGNDFIREARLIYHIAACGGGDAPDGFDAAVVENHCRLLQKYFEIYRRDFADKAT